ncbi:MAG: hypothetical protein ACO3TE_06685 [bacterium]
MKKFQRELLSGIRQFITSIELIAAVVAELLAITIAVAKDLREISTFLN